MLRKRRSVKLKLTTQLCLIQSVGWRAFGDKGTDQGNAVTILAKEVPTKQLGGADNV